ADGLADGGAGAAAGAGRLLVAWGAPTLGWVSGHYLGDWFDRELDALSKPQRPLPSGRLSPRAAVVCGAGCAAAAAVAAASANWRTVLLVALAMLGIVAYSRLFKGRGLTGNAVRGALTATTVVFGAMTVTELPSWQVLVLAGVFWAQDTASNLVGTLRDVEGDRRGGFRTVPVRRGLRTAVRMAALLHAAALVTAAPTLLLATAHPGNALPLLLCAAGCGAAAFLPLLRGTDGHHTALTPERALRAHEVLVAQRMLLAGALLAAGWTLPPALLVVLPLLLASLYAQGRMRSRHEFPDAECVSSGTTTERGAAGPQETTR
ncbi:UbiA family prenyltransferase, partial [Streptomyces nanshensis]